MFFHNFKYILKTGLRRKDVIIWMILFPIALGTFFKMAFGNIYDGEMKFTAIKVAVVEKADDGGYLRSVLDELSRGDDALFSVTYTDAEKAEKMLGDDDVKGIITADSVLSLVVSENSLKSTILEKFIEEYNLNADIIKQTYIKDPENIGKVTQILTEDINTVKAKALSKGNTNVYDQYFYNLIAMVALFGSLAGLYISIENQGNLSALGARKGISPTPKALSILADLMAHYVVQSVCMIICVSYVRFGLGIDMGNRLGFFYLTGIVAGNLGVTLGFCLGSVGRMSADTKNGIATGITLLLCFMSGLMDGGMKQKVAESAPWFNKVNPAAVICESLFSLNIYEDYTRYTRCMITMLVMTAVFMVLGFVMTRRRKYASL